jgi:uncharacterized protein
MARGEIRAMTIARGRARLAMAAVAVAAMCSAGAATWDVNKDGLRPIPALSSHVTDVTNTLSAGERQALDSKLSAWEARTTNQLAVLVVPTTTPEAIEDYGIRVADAWKIGQKGNDNGAIFIVAKDDKRMRIEVGYGFEGVLTDVTSRRIIAENVAPLFSQGKFAEGIDAGVDRIIAVVDDGNPLPPPGKTARKPARSGNIDFGTLFIVMLVAVPIIGGVLRSMLGNFGGSIVGGGIAGVAAWFVAGSLLIAGAAGVVAFFIILFSILGGRGGFGGGGASGGWN